MDPYEHDRAMADSYADEYVRAREHQWPEIHIRYAVGKAVREGYLKACAERDALKARNEEKPKCEYCDQHSDCCGQRCSRCEATQDEAQLTDKERKE